MEILTGSICLSNIPKEQMKKVMCKDGVERIFLNVAVIEKKEKGKFGDTHFVSCSPKKEDRKENVNYIIGDLKRLEMTSNTPSTEQIDNAPSVDDSDLPF